MLCHPFQGMDDGQELPDIISPLLEGACMEDLVTGPGEYAAILKITRGSITGCIYADRGNDRLIACVLPFPQ